VATFHPALVPQWLGLNNPIEDTATNPPTLLHNRCFMNTYLKTVATGMIDEALKPQGNDNANVAALRIALSNVVQFIRAGKTGANALLPNGSQNKAYTNQLQLALSNAMKPFPTLGRFVGCDQQDASEIALGIGDILRFEEFKTTSFIQYFVSTYQNGSIRTVGRVSTSPNMRSPAVLSITPNPLFLKADTVTLQQVVDGRTAPDEREITEGGVNTKINQREIFSDLPETLMLFVARQNADAGTLEYIPKTITFNPSEEIRFENWTAKLGQGAAASAKLVEYVYYRAIAVGIQSGSATGGHYYAFVADDKNAWYRQDDYSPSSLANQSEISDQYTRNKDGTIALSRVLYLFMLKKVRTVPT
jgi:hypothetical protein